MTIGIYRLCFSGTDSCYIGQSINIEQRYREHLRNFINKNHYPKMMDAYLKYGQPELDILCECNVEDLNALENEAIQIFDSVNNGFNTNSRADQMPVLYGESNGYSKYSNNQIIQVAKLLTEVGKTHSDISNLTGVSISTIRHISCLEGHNWLAEIEPEIYSKLIKLKGSRKTVANNTYKYPDVISPDGVVYRDIPNISAFSKEHSLNNGNFTMLLQGKRKIHKGWRLCTNG
jgi:hypothetical protein